MSYYEVAFSMIVSFGIGALIGAIVAILALAQPGPVTP